MKYLFNLSKILASLGLITVCYGVEKEIEGHPCTFVGPSWYYSPKLVEQKKQSYEHLPVMQYQSLNNTAKPEIIKVQMGEIKTAIVGENKILYSTGIYDCIGIVVRGPESVLLGHISYDPHTSYKSHRLLDHEISKLTNKAQYEAILTTGYYSDNLDKVKSILHIHNIPIKGIDTSDAYADYTPFIEDREWGVPDFHFTTKNHREIQIHALVQKEISIHTQTLSISNKVPKQ